MPVRAFVTLRVVFRCDACGEEWTISDYRVEIGQPVKALCPCCQRGAEPVKEVAA